VTGWGRKDEGWIVYDEIQKLGGPAWFHLGDQDLATHLERTRRLQSGEPLSKVTRDFCAAWGISAQVLPATDDPMPTWVNTVEAGWLPFQEYFVKLGCQPVVKGFEFRGQAEAKPAPGVIEAIQDADCIMICPSNPWVSIAPILSVPGVHAAVQQCPIRMVMSPIVGGKALKGPAAKMYAELGISPSALSVARQYQDLCTDFILDQVDQALTHEIEMLDMAVLVTDTVMATLDDRVRVAHDVLDYFMPRIPKELT
jgi:LPPG:FO 2-phospho-L-lactate transferase